MDVKIVVSEDELIKIAPVLLQLRPEYDAESLIVQIKKQFRNGFQIAYVENEGRVVCVAGYVFCEKRAWGKSIYIDDLVTDENFRSNGAGKTMIDWFKQYAKAHGHSQIHLDSRNIRVDAHRFYVREGFSKESFHFALVDF